VILAIFTSLIERERGGLREGERNNDRGEKQKMEREYILQGERKLWHRIYRRSSVKF
jgi:hypothetical protein